MNRVLRSLVSILPLLFLACGGSSDASAFNSGDDSGAPVDGATDGSTTDASGTDAADSGPCTPGATEKGSCGKCGSQIRVCNSTAIWSNWSTCSGETGECEAGKTETMACPTGGTQTRICSATCAWSPFGACVGDVTCMAGATEQQACGMCGKQLRVCGSDKKWSDWSTCTEGTCSKSVDVMLLLDVSGSTISSLTAAIPNLKSRLVTALLALPDVNVGVAYTCDFPTSPYGTTGDRAFQAGVEPGTASATILGAIDGYPTMSGGDASDGMVEALATLSGLPIHPTSKGFVCSSGRLAGGCWRSGAKRVIVLFTDDSFHNGPDPSSTALYAPYTGITPAPQTWTAAASVMKALGTTLLIMNADATSPTEHVPQYDEMLTDLGQPSSDVYPASSSTLAGTASDAIVARINGIRTK